MSSIFKSIGKFVSSILKPKIPKIEMPAMPDPGSAASKLAAQRKIASKSGNGRAGTIYSGDGAYQGLNLGGTS